MGRPHSLAPTAPMTASLPALQDALICLFPAPITALQMLGRSPFHSLAASLLPCRTCSTGLIAAPQHSCARTRCCAASLSCSLPTLQDIPHRPERRDAHWALCVHRQGLHDPQRNCGGRGAQPSLTGDSTA